MTNITVGTYQPLQSVIHRLNPLAKIICMILLLASIIACSTVAGYAILLAVTIAAVALSRLKIGLVIAAIRSTAVFLVIIFMMNFLFYSSENSWISLWIFTPTYEGLKQGADIVIKVILLIVLGNVLTMTTSPTEITRALEQIMYPLSFIGLPTAQIAMILSMAIQFIPTLSEEAQTIKLAQTARGADFNSRRLSKRITANMSIIIPIFFSAFKRADELSLAMEARGYRIHKKRAPKMPRLQARDFAVLASCTAILILILFL